jgi:glutamate-1-semialdehyde 2,1-aminomutase
VNDVERHEHLIPMGTQVSSKGRFRNCRGFGPDWLEYGRGSKVSDGNRTWIDWSCGLGALTLGHGALNEDYTPQCLPLPTRWELKLAERLHEWVPCAERVRFLKTGSDATNAAIRLARVYTGREKIVDAGNYHGIGDWTISAEHEGVPACVRALTARVPYNDLEEVEDHLGRADCAALILEPVSLIAPYDWYLSRLRELCDKTGTVLIFDEVITGIRMAKGGAQEVYGVTPDLCAIGKGMANGYPISALCGVAKVMDCWSRTHLSGTHFADPGCMAAAYETMERMEAGDFWAHQLNIGHALMTAVKGLVQSMELGPGVRVLGHPHWWCIQITNPLSQTLVQQELIRRGVLGSNGSHFVSLSHTNSDVINTITAYREAFVILRDAQADGTVAQRLVGPANQVVFRRA